MRIHRAAFACGLLLAMISAASAAPPHYTATILDVPPGLDPACDTHVTMINNRGQVLGRFACPSGFTGLIVWTDAKPAIQLEPFGYSGSGTFSATINNNGVVTGSIRSQADTFIHPVQWTNAQPVLHALVPGATNDAGIMTDDSGDLVVATDSPGTAAVMWIGNLPVNLGAAPGVCAFHPSSVNDVRQVAGLNDPLPHGADCNNAEVMQPGAAPIALQFTGPQISQGPSLTPLLVAINNFGHIAGTVTTGPDAIGNTAGYLWVNGVAQTVFPPGPFGVQSILGLNNLDQVLTFNPFSIKGLASNFGIWQNGQSYSLDGLITLPLNVSFRLPPSSLNVLNDNGQIALDALVSCGPGCVSVQRGVMLAPDNFVPGTMSLSQTRLNFGITTAMTTSPQNVTLTFSGGGSRAWTATSVPPNVTVTPASGTGNATLRITGAAGASGVVTITAPGAINSPQQVVVNVANVTPNPPFGSFDTPIDNTSGVSGAIAVTGWALDNVEMTAVDIWREKVVSESGSGLVFIGNAVLVGARPDVQAANPTAPLNYRAGWGYLLLTTGLPNSNGSAGTGNGTYKLHAIAHNSAGLLFDLGTRTIIVDNAHASKPFGTIDTPDQGGTVSGSAFVNFGWALTQNPHTIPKDGSTISVTVDGQTLGHPVYNQFRSDLATAFPGLANSLGAVGYFTIDTTKLANGVHTIGWLVYDDANRGDGLGSRFFNVLNSGPGPEAGPDDPIVPVDHVTVRRGFEAPELLAPHHNGYDVDVAELGRLELQLGAVSGYLDVGGERQPLPIGSSMRAGTFYWQLGPGFYGTYPLVFARPDGARIQIRVRVVAAY